MLNRETVIRYVVTQLHFKSQKQIDYPRHLVENLPKFNLAVFSVLRVDLKGKDNTAFRINVKCKDNTALRTGFERRR